MQTLLLERSGAVVTVTLNRPAVRNALDQATFDALRAALDDVARNPADRVVVITGAGGTFCSGGDLTPAPADTAAPEPVPMTTLKMLRDTVGATAMALHRFPKPVIAAVEGVAAGAGACLALGCDLVLASETARFSFLFVRRGLSLDFGGSWLLPRLVGLQRAKELAFFGDWVDAAEAAQLGLVNKVLPAAEFSTGVRSWAERLAAQSPAAMTLIKQSLNRAMEIPMNAAVEEEAMAQAVCAASPEFVEILAAFASRRKEPS